MLDQKEATQNLTTIASEAMSADDCREGTTCPGEMVAVEKISQAFHRLRARVD